MLHAPPKLPLVLRQRVAFQKSQSARRLAPDQQKLPKVRYQHLPVVFEVTPDLLARGHGAHVIRRPLDLDHAALRLLPAERRGVAHDLIAAELL